MRLFDAESPTGTNDLSDQGGKQLPQAQRLLAIQQQIQQQIQQSRRRSGNSRGCIECFLACGQVRFAHTLLLVDPQQKGSKFLKLLQIKSSVNPMVRIEPTESCEIWALITNTHAGTGSGRNTFSVSHSPMWLSPILAGSVDLQGWNLVAVHGRRHGTILPTSSKTFDNTSSAAFADLHPE